MGLIREPIDVDLIVERTELTEDDRREFSRVIAEYYQLHGRVQVAVSDDSEALESPRTEECLCESVTQ